MKIMSNFFDKYDSYEDMPPDVQESFMSKVMADATATSSQNVNIIYRPTVPTFKELAKRGLTDDQIADCCNMSMENFEALLCIEEELEDAIKCGRAQGVSEVQGSLFRSAVRGNQDAIRFYLKNCSDLEDGPQGRQQKRRFKSDNFEDEMKKATERLFSE